MKKVLLNSKLPYEKMQTVLYEIESVLNNRPLYIWQHFSKRNILVTRPQSYRTSDIEPNAIDNVLIYGKHLPRTLYRTGVVESFIGSSDGKKRIANITKYFKRKDQTHISTNQETLSIRSCESSEPAVRVIGE